MKVILTQDVRGQGKKGQLIDAAEGYARNFLLPRKLAVLATADAINTMNLKEKARRAEEAANRQAAVEMGGKLKNVTVKLTAKGGKEGKLFGAITSKEISEGLASQFQLDVPKQKIVLDEPIKAFGTYEVKAKLESGELHVFDCSTFTVDGQPVTSYMADVDTDPDYTPDTEVVQDGYLAESTARSAPYFQLMIDGIDLLDTNFG